MKDFVLRLAFLIFTMIVIPVIVLFVSGKNSNHDSYMITLYNHKTQTTESINLEKYIVGVVCAEMPAVFSTEALKAQSIAARSYALRKINSGSNEHPDSDLCTDYSHCQAYLDEDVLKKNWGKDYEKNYSKIKNAVKATSGEYLAYNGEVAATVFHSCSNGVTEKASDVWGSDYPYLVNVESKGDFERSDYCVSKEITVEEYVRIISEFSGENLENIKELTGEITLTSGNNIESIELCDKKFRGTDVRKMFGLRSTSFEINFVDDKVIFNMYGNGHGVGMSQYGANSMAEQGNDYTRILSHYYPGTNIVNMYK